MSRRPEAVARRSVRSTLQDKMAAPFGCVSIGSGLLTKGICGIINQRQAPDNALGG